MEVMKKLQFCEQGDEIILKVEDDGIGFSKKAGEGLNKLGILGMKESISHLGGKIDIKGTAGKGTVVSVSCPRISYERKL